eukprot:1971389-Prymnesium_polylepis.1
MAEDKGASALLLSPIDLQRRVIVKGNVRNRSARLSKQRSNSCFKAAERLKRSMTVGTVSRDSERQTSGRESGRESGCENGHESGRDSRDSRK